MMRTIDVCLSPDLMHLYPVEDKTVVVVDILRATSCMTTAFAHGVRSIIPVATLEECLSFKSADTFTAGERDGRKVDGFDLGNSPFEYMHPGLAGKQIAFTTTNGTQAIVKSVGAQRILVGSFLNLAAVTDTLLQSQNSLLIVCAGWKGKFNLEDTLFAGALVEQLHKAFHPACDAPLAAQYLYNTAKHNLADFLKNSSHVQRLARLGIEKDIFFCLEPDQYDVVPSLEGGVLTC